MQHQRIRNDLRALHLETLVVPATALIAAAFAAYSDAAPTGLSSWDLVLKAGLAALFVYAAAAAPNGSVVVAAAIAVAVIGSGAWLAPTMLGLVLAIGAGALPSNQPWMRIVAAGLIVQGLLRIPDIGFFGLPSVIAGVAIIIVLIAGYVGSPRRVRRIARRSVLAVALIAIIAAAVGGFTLYTARADVDRGVSAARAGLRAARGGDPQAVVAELETAADALGAAQETTSGLLTQPLRLLPVAAQHRHAVVVATTQGRNIARQASRTTIDADISSISMNAGSIDLGALSSMQRDLARTVDLLEAGVDDLDDAMSPWLVSPISSRMVELTDEMRSVLPEARVAADAAAVLPDMLGQRSPRRYFVAFGSPAESRELGGFIGSWAVLEFDRGRISQVEAGRIADLYDLTRAQAPITREDYPRWYAERMQPHQWPQNLSGSPDIVTVAQASRELLDGIADGSIDGVVYLDAYALSAILRLTGPLRIDGVDDQITTRNVAGFLFEDQFRLDNRQQLKSEASEIFSQAFTDLIDAELPGPERLGEILGPAARQGRLQVATYDDDENAFLQSIKLQRAFGWPVDEAADSLVVIQNNGLRNKLDVYLQRSITYDATVDETGNLSVSGSIELSLNVPDDVPQYALGGDVPGTSLVYLSLYTPHRMSNVVQDGEPIDQSFSQEFGYGRNEFSVLLEPNTTHVVEFELDGQVDPAQSYDVLVWHQPLVNNDAVQLSYTNAAGQTTTEQIELTENVVVSFD